NVDRRDDVDTGGEELVDVLPALLVLRTGHVRVGEFVDQHLLRLATKDRVDVHLFERGAAIFEGATGHDLEVAELFGSLGSAVGLDVADDNIGAPGVPAARFVQHREGLPDAGGRA